MRHRLLHLALVLLAVAGAVTGLVGLAPTRTGGAPPLPPRPAGTGSQVLLVVLDGLPAPVAQDESYMPGLVALGRRGAWGTARTPFGFSVTGTAVYTLLTGCESGPLQLLMTIRSARAGLDTLFHRCREAGRTTGVFGAIIWADLAGRESIDLLRSTGEIENPADLEEADEATTAAFEATGTIPDLAVVHYYGSDHAGHRFARTDPRYRSVIEGIDAKIGRILARVPGRDVLVVADHGMTPAGAHGGYEPVQTLAPLVAVGPGFRRAEAPVRIRQAEIPATLAWLLGVEAPHDAAFGPATELLATPPPVPTPSPTGHPLPRVPVVLLGLLLLGVAVLALGRLEPVPLSVRGPARLALLGAAALAVLGAIPATRPWAPLPIGLALLVPAMRRGDRSIPALAALTIPWIVWLAWGGPPGLVSPEGWGLQAVPGTPWVRLLGLAVLLAWWIPLVRQRRPGGLRLAILLGLTALLTNGVQFATLSLLLWGAARGFPARPVAPGWVWLLGIAQYFIIGGHLSVGRLEMATSVLWLYDLPAWLLLPLLFLAGLARYLLPWLVIASLLGPIRLDTIVPPFIVLVGVALLAGLAPDATDPLREALLHVVALATGFLFLIGILGSLTTSGGKPAPLGNP